MSEHVRIVLHAKEADNRQLRAAVESIRREGANIDVAVTWEAGDALRLANEAACLGVDRVVAAGGDGTINEVVRGIASVDNGPALGLIPLGTANDLATALELPLNDIEEATRIAVQSNPSPVDLGCFDDGKNPRYFLNAVTGGFGSEVTSETPEGLKKFLGGLAYMITGMTNAASVEARPLEVSLHDQQTDEGVSWAGEALLLAVCNGRRVGGRPVSEDAVLNDGLLDVLLLPSLEAGRWSELLALARDVGFQSAFEAEQLSWQTRELSVKAPRTMQFNLDGEPITTEQASIQCQAEQIRLCVPDGSPLLG